MPAGIQLRSPAGSRFLSFAVPSAQAQAAAGLATQSRHPSSSGFASAPSCAQPSDVSYGTAQCSTDFFLPASRPAFVFPGVCDADRQVVATLIAPLSRARWAACEVVTPDPPFLPAEVLQDRELSADPVAVRSI